MALSISRGGKPASVPAHESGRSCCAVGAASEDRAVVSTGFSPADRPAPTPAGDIPRPAAGGPADAPRPAQPSRRRSFPTWIDLLALVGLFAVVQLAAGLALLLAGAKMPDAAALGSPDEAVAAQAQAAAAQFNFCAYPLTMGLMILLTLLYRRLRGGSGSLGRYAARGLNPGLILWGMMLMTAASVLLEPLLDLLPEIPDCYGRGWRTLLLTVAVAPAAEEFLCRGILLDAARAKGGAVYGLFFSAAFFGLIHFHPAAVVNAFVMGLILGCVYIRSDSLYLAVILHAFNNALAMLLLTLGYGRTTLAELLAAHGWGSLYGVIYVVSLVVFLAAGCGVWKTLQRLRREERAAAR